jgi:hypothetical protein
MKKFLLLLDGMTGAGKTATSDILSEKLTRTAIISMDKIKTFVSDFESSNLLRARAIISSQNEKRNKKSCGVNYWDYLHNTWCAWFGIAFFTRRSIFNYWFYTCFFLLSKNKFVDKKTHRKTSLFTRHCE